jgi:hypothetical protein
MEYYIKYHTKYTRARPTSGMKTKAVTLTLIDVCFVILTVLGGGLSLAAIALIAEKIYVDIKAHRCTATHLGNGCR